ncbi:MAG: tetratricopeptide repeat protein [Caldilineaceae bacterium]|nr:tetratricopeptide repeat protein [Caldilineaceae bacterium]
MILSAQSAQQAGDPQKSQEQVEIAGLLAPDLPQLSSQKIYATLDLGSAATIGFGEAAALAASTYSPGLNNAAVLAFSTEDLSTSKAMLERAVLLNPESAQAHYNLGIVAYQSGDVETARPAFRRATFLAPDWPHPYVYLAALSLHANDPTSALEMARTAVALDPTIRLAQTALLYALWVSEQPDEGLEAVEQALHEFPQDPTFLLYQGLFLRSKGADDQALVTLRQAFFIDQVEDQRRRIAQEILAIMKGE